MEVPILPKLIQARDKILSNLRYLDQQLSNKTNATPEEANKRIKDSVGATKSKWRSHLANIVSKMNFVPKIS